jgi:uncharacterized membrane protein YccC
MVDRLRKLIIAKENSVSVTHSARTAAIAVISFFVAELLRLPEAYWAAITTLIVVESTSATPISAQYFVGTAVGAAIGGFAGSYFSGNVFVFGLCILAIGAFLAPLGVERSAFRYAGTTLAIVMLVPSHSGWLVALHRFFEVSVGIAVGLGITAIWPERRN